jgi:hypothetical protein
MAYIDLVTIADIEAYTGVVYDSAQSLALENIINAVFEAIEGYTQNEFLPQLRYERVSLADGVIVSLFPQTRMHGVFTGVTEVIKVTSPSYSASICFARDSTDDLCFILQEAGSYEEIPVGTQSLSDLITAINNFSGGWVATNVGASGYIASALAGQIWQGDYTSPDDTNLDFYLMGATTKVSVSKMNNKVLQCPEILSDGILIYHSGYSVLPSDLKDAIIRFVIQSYGDSAVVNTETKKSETIGDYSYTNMTDTDINGGGNAVGTNSLSIKLSYYNILDKYKNYHI